MAIKKAVQNKNPMDEFINGASTNGETEKEAASIADSKQMQSKSNKGVDKPEPQHKTSNTVMSTNANSCTTFTTPLNLYELCALRFLASQDERSMRQMGRRLWAKLIVAEAEKDGFNPETAISYIEEKEQKYIDQFE